MAKSARTRLDVALVERGLVPSRARAQSLIMARRILVNGRHADKAGAPVTEDDELAIEELEHPWVGRGGMKLDAALRHFELDVSGLVCADIGASTGGFTDVLLQRGAARVHAVDVGYGQLDSKLRADSRVVNHERVNARNLELEDLGEAVAFVSVDVSFISLRLILPAIRRILQPDGRLVALIKPQFEVGKHEVGKGGIVRDPALRQSAIDGIVQAAGDEGFEVLGVIDSPVAGAEGNVEALLYAVVSR